MRMYDIIQKKRDKKELSEAEISYFIEGYTAGEIPDYQASALLMAIYINKMSRKETAHLTKAMLESGDTVDLSGVNGRKVDKHSTGGVGDKTTLILGPMVAACGLPFSKMSGRGLGHTGGTLDKLDSIDGFRTQLTEGEFLEIINKTKLCICSQSGNIAPADKKIYSLRDVTATVDNISLIAASVMSKKLSLKSDAIVIDVKVGSGAFMKNLDDAYELSNEMVRIGQSFDREIVCYLTDMDQPLGNAVGNALEVAESVETLKNNGPKDLTELCLVLGEELLLLGNAAKTKEEARAKLLDTLESGAAYRKFLEMVESQGGNTEQIEDTSKLPKAKYVMEVRSDAFGHVEAIEAEEVGKTALMVGAGRETKESEIDLSAGVVISKKIGDAVVAGEIIGYVHCNDEQVGKSACERLRSAYSISKNFVPKRKLILGKVDRDGIKTY